MPASRMSLALRQLDVEAGVENVGGCHALVHEAGFRPDMLGKVRQKGDDVVLGFRFDRIDAPNVEFGSGALFPDDVGGFFRMVPRFGHGAGGVRLDLEPDPEAALRSPDCCHFGTGIARYHGRARRFWYDAKLAEVLCSGLQPGSRRSGPVVYAVVA